MCREGGGPRHRACECLRLVGRTGLGPLPRSRAPGPRGSGPKRLGARRRAPRHHPRSERGQRASPRWGAAALTLIFFTPREGARGVTPATGLSRLFSTLSPTRARGRVSVSAGRSDVPFLAVSATPLPGNTVSRSKCRQSEQEPRRMRACRTGSGVSEGAERKLQLGGLLSVPRAF